MVSKNIKHNQPVYKQIKDDLLNEITNKNLLPFVPIPSESELSDVYGVSRLTVRAALLDLQREGILQSVPGKGVYVMGDPVVRNLDILEGFTRSIKGLNKKPKNSIIKKNIREAGPFFSNLFDINEDDEIYYIKRLSSIDDIPAAIEEIFIPKEILPNIMNINTSDFSIHNIYAQYGVNYTHAKQVLEVTRVDQNEARLLKIDKDEPVFLLKSITFNNDKPIEYSLNYANGEIQRFRSEFNKDFLQY